MGSPMFSGPEPLLILMAALVVDALAGAWIRRVLPDAASLAKLLFAEIERRLNRSERTERTRLIRGLLATLVVVVAAIGTGLAVERVGGGRLVDFVVILWCLGGGAAWRRAQAVGRVLENKGTVAAAADVATMTRRRLDPRDGHAMVRAVIEHLAKAFDRAFIAPAFWYVFLGVPGILMWTAIDGADAALGAPGIRTSAFGLTAARLDDALNAIPARLAAVLLAVAAAFLGGADVAGAVRTAARDSRRSPSFNMGWPIAATAGALGLSLAGPYRDGGVAVNEPWLGQGRARAVPADIGRSLALTGLSALLTILAVGLLLGAVAGL